MRLADQRFGRCGSELPAYHEVRHWFLHVSVHFENLRACDVLFAHGLAGTLDPRFSTALTRISVVPIARRQRHPIPLTFPCQSTSVGRCGARLALYSASFGGWGLSTHSGHCSTPSRRLNSTQRRRSTSLARSTHRVPLRAFAELVGHIGSCRSRPSCDLTGDVGAGDVRDARMMRTKGCGK
jgi:hypothetical protein